MTGACYAYDSRCVCAELTNALYNFIGGEKRPPVFLCIGSDRITGDCLGPLTGHLLTAGYSVGAYVYGTLANPVTAKNLAETADFIVTRHRSQKLVVVDASLGRPEDIGLIRLGAGGIEPGSAVDKKLPVVGDFHITAVVNAVSVNHVLLQSTRLSLIFRISEVIASAVKNCLILCRDATLAV